MSVSLPACVFVFIHLLSTLVFLCRAYKRFKTKKSRLCKSATAKKKKKIHTYTHKSAVVYTFFDVTVSGNIEISTSAVIKMLPPLAVNLQPADSEWVSSEWQYRTLLQFLRYKNACDQFCACIWTAQQTWWIWINPSITEKNVFVLFICLSLFMFFVSFLNCGVAFSSLSVEVYQCSHLTSCEYKVIETICG